MRELVAGFFVLVFVGCGRRSGTTEDAVAKTSEPRPLPTASVAKLGKKAEASSLDFRDCEVGDEFMVAGVCKGEAETFLRRLQDSIATADAAKFAAYVSFPAKIVVNRRTKQVLMIDGVAEFVKKSSVILSNRVRSEVLAASTTSLVPGYEGVRIGTGSIWFNNVCGVPGCEGVDSIKVTSISPTPIESAR